MLKHKVKRTYQTVFANPLNDNEYKRIRQTLSPELQSLFFSQLLCDQRHGLLVYDEAKTTDITDEELFIASLLHDIAKKDCNFRTLNRIIASLIEYLPEQVKEKLLNTNCNYAKRIGIYLNHSELSWEYLKPYITGDFIKNAVLYHHGYSQEIILDEQQKYLLDLFIEADDL